jgi:hypothetical protein
MIFFVVSETELSFPHIIQPRAKTFTSSAITISSEDNLYSLSSKAKNFSSCFANLITIFHFTLSASKI